ncbi:MAG: cysteine hydrolase [Actinomycetota bacterium]|jgi:ureidoacrylate peracid hydrolase|nr:cysteine hydrolase [Actinomycetota bacterium]
MHPVSVSDEVRSAVAERRGRVWAHEGYDPSATALVVVDMQNHFVAEGGLSEVPVARGIVDNINRLATAVREAGGTVVWVYSTFTAEGRGAWNMFFANFISPERQHEVRAGLMDGSWGHEFYDQLEIDEGDVLVSKDRFSALAHGASDLDSQLRSRDVDTVLVTGTMTNVCCDSTARDAMMLDYRAVLVDDANAARTDEAHVAALTTFASVFGDVMSTDEAIGAMRQG